MSQKTPDNAKIKALQEPLKKVQTEMKKIIVGQETLIHRLLIALFTRGHILLEGVPGLAKTTAIVTLAKACKTDFQRLQFTPDLLPSDLIGSRVFDAKKMEFFIKKGPIFSNFILADEINRSPAKVQSALLEAMAERQITIGEETFVLPEPFLVLATQNPVEQEGTFPLPEAQMDRFLLKTVLEYPTPEEEIEILHRIESLNFNDVKPILTVKQILEIQKLVDEVFVDDSLKEYIANIVAATRDPESYNMKKLKNLIAYGASPRGTIGLMRTAKANALLDGRGYVIPEDIKAIAYDVLRHRIVPNYEAQAEGVTAEDIITELLKQVKVP